MTDEVAVSFSWLGTKKKGCMQKMAVAAAIRSP